MSECPHLVAEELPEDATEDLHLPARLTCADCAAADLAASERREAEARAALEALRRDHDQHVRDTEALADVNAELSARESDLRAALRDVVEEFEGLGTPFAALELTPPCRMRRHALLTRVRDLLSSSPSPGGDNEESTEG